MLRLSGFFVVLCLLLMSQTGCKSTNSAAAAKDDDDVGTVLIPVAGGPGKISVTVAERELLADVTVSGNIFRNPAFWSFFAAHHDLAHQLLEGPWLRSLPLERQKILDAASSVGDHFILFLDLGIAVRAAEFRAFAQARLATEPEISSFDLREAFAASLPKATVWRGVLLTPAEAVVVRAEGIKASGFYAEQGLRNSVFAGEYLGRSTFANHPLSSYDDLNRRLGGQTRTSVYASYSRWIEVTYAGAWLPAVQGGGPLRHGTGMRFYLFKVEVSELDLIRPNGMLFPLIQNKVNQVYKTLGLDGQPWEKSFGDPEFEMFIQFVKPEEILEMRAYEQMPPKWRT